LHCSANTVGVITKEAKKGEGWDQHGTRNANGTWIRNFKREKRLERRTSVGGIILKLVIKKKCC
jgi:hypothetical protein